MKNSFIIIGLLAFFAMSCEVEPDPIPEPLKLSTYIVGDWDLKVEGTPIVLHHTFLDDTYFIEYSVDGRTFKSEPAGYAVNDETNEIQLVNSTFWDSEEPLSFGFHIPDYFVEMTTGEIMTWESAKGKVCIFTRGG